MLQLRKQIFPDFLPLVIPEILVVEHDMNTGDESVVEGAHSIGGEKEDATIVLIMSLSAQS